MTSRTGNWIENCPVCYCSVSNQLRDKHIEYHRNLIAISEAKK